jgi:hypothetical protein
MNLEIFRTLVLRYPWILGLFNSVLGTLVFTVPLNLQRYYEKHIFGYE